jgi:hypothetical protein
VAGLPLLELKVHSANKGTTGFVSAHPDDDHLRGLAYLHAQMNLVNFYSVKNDATKPDWTDDFEQYCQLRDDTKKAFSLFRGCCASP